LFASVIAAVPDPMNVRFWRKADICLFGDQFANTFANCVS
jgi:hypothetical protein